jgi:hypothetical protein
LATIRQLIGAHANVNAKDQNGESVLDWALKFRDPAVIATLRAAGAKVLPGGQEIDDKTLSHAPLLRKHINPFGRYHFDLDRIGKPQAGAPAKSLTEVFGWMWLLPHARAERNARRCYRKPMRKCWQAWNSRIHHNYRKYPLQELALPHLHIGSSTKTA